MSSNIGHKNEARNSNFVFTIGFDRELSLAVQNTNITGLQFGETLFPGQPKDMKLASNKIEHEPLMCEFLVSEDLSEWVAIYKWIMQLKNTNNNVVSSNIPCTMIVLDSQSQPAIKFHYSYVFPIELTGLQYSIAEDGSQVITFTTTFMFNKFTIEQKDGIIIEEDYV